MSKLESPAASGPDSGAAAGVHSGLHMESEPVVEVSALRLAARSGMSLLRSLMLDLLGLADLRTVREQKAKVKQKAKVRDGFEKILGSRAVWLDEAGGGWYLPAGPVAQLVEQRTFNPTVRGSSPRGLTK